MPRGQGDGAQTFVAPDIVKRVLVQRDVDLEGKDRLDASIRGQRYTRSGRNWLGGWKPS